MSVLHPTTSPLPGSLPPPPQFFMVAPGYYHQPWNNPQEPPLENTHAAKPDRYLVGLLAGAALFYLLGHSLGLGRR